MVNQNYKVHSNLGQSQHIASFEQNLNKDGPGEHYYRDDDDLTKFDSADDANDLETCALINATAQSNPVACFVYVFPYLYLMIITFEIWSIDKFYKM